MAKLAGTCGKACGYLWGSWQAPVGNPACSRSCRVGPVGTGSQPAAGRMHVRSLQAVACQESNHTPQAGFELGCWPRGSAAAVARGRQGNWQEGQQPLSSLGDWKGSSREATGEQEGQQPLSSPVRTPSSSVPPPVAACEPSCLRRSRASECCWEQVGVDFLGGPPLCTTHHQHLILHLELSSFPSSVCILYACTVHTIGATRHQLVCT